MLLAWYDVWFGGQPWPQRCEGCTFCVSQMQRLEYLHSRDITAAVVWEGDSNESQPYAEVLTYVNPLYYAPYARSLVVGRGFGLHACYVRDHDQVYGTYWITDRGTETRLWSYALMDMMVFGRQEAW